MEGLKRLPSFHLCLQIWTRNGRRMARQTGAMRSWSTLAGNQTQHKSAQRFRNSLLGNALPSSTPLVERMMGININSPLSASYRSSTGIFRREQEKYASMTEEEFDRIVSALEIYKQLYGHLFLSRNFEVPLVFTTNAHDTESGAPTSWPRELAGLRLGYLAEVFRTQNSAALRGKEWRREKLEKLGFPWHAIIPHFDTLLKEDPEKIDRLCCVALTRYVELYGVSFISIGFRVPNTSLDWPAEVRAFPLGRELRMFSHADTFYSHSQTYKLLSTFTPPSAAPANGSAVKDNTETDDTYNTYSTFIGHKRRTLRQQAYIAYELLCAYKKVYGSCEQVPRTFSVPRGPEWPAHFANYQLGRSVEFIHKYKNRFLADAPDIVEKLIALGNKQLSNPWKEFLTYKRSLVSRKTRADVNLNLPDKSVYDRLYDAFTLYKEQMGDLNIPHNYVISALPVQNKDGAQFHWPAHVMGIRLGYHAARIKQGFETLLMRHYPRLLDMVALGLLNAEEAYIYKARQAMEAARIYAKIHGHIQVPLDFVVPPRGVPENIKERKLGRWLNGLEGLPLGEILEKIRREPMNGYVRGNVGRRNYLDGLGIKWEQPNEIDFIFDAHLGPLPDYTASAPLI